MILISFLFSVGRKPKPQQSPVSNGSPELGVKKRPREGKGNGRFCAGAVGPVLAGMVALGPPHIEPDFFPNDRHGEYIHVLGSSRYCCCPRNYCSIYGFLWEPNLASLT